MSNDEEVKLDPIANVEGGPPEISAVDGAETKQAEAPAKKAPDQDEATARHNGWVAKEEWVAAGKPPEAWHDAKTHNVRALFIGDLNKQKREIEELKSTTREMAVHNQRLNVAHKRQLTELETKLKSQRNEAIIEGDDAKADQLETELNNVRQEVKDIAQAEMARKAAESATATVHPSERPIFQTWLKDNGWWNTDPAKRERALGIGAIMSATPEGKAMSEEAFLTEVSRRIRESDAPPKTPTVESGKGRGNNGGGKKLTDADLTPGERRAMKGFVDNGTMTKDQYLAEVAELRQQ